MRDVCVESGVGGTSSQVSSGSGSTKRNRTFQSCLRGAGTPDDEETPAYEYQAVSPAPGTPQGTFYILSVYLVKTVLYPV